jgi:hypothetical protein
MWQDEPLHVRTEYKARSEQMKAEHLLKYPGYSYQPRKPSQKKRRMTKTRKAPKPSRSLRAARQYPRMAQATGSLGGNAGGVRTATLPVSAATVVSINGHNAMHGGSNGIESPATPSSVVQSAEYVAMQQADELALDLALDPDFVDEFMGLDATYQGQYQLQLDPYQTAVTSFPSEWDY